ncbi:unnamed protein product [Symbiodinium natans]|uniref:Uncharacterized protein n=1 Tax=Symbiodinium natans TaxID=878477 RepID=A0A812JRC7_9DINO|nr:unnamed protein product [Symbiodinium natans]
MFCRCCCEAEPRPQLEKVVAHQTLNVDNAGSTLELPHVLKLGLSPVREEPGQETPQSRSGGWEYSTARVHYTLGSQLGLMLDVSNPECCLVKGINPEGLLAKCATYPPGKVISQWMRLWAVNGMRGSSEDLVGKIEEIYCLDGLLDLTFEHPRGFSFDLAKHGNSDLGMELKAHDTSVGISSITGGGIVAEYNASVSEDRRIGLSSRIIAVDGSSAGGGKRMRESLC